MRPVSLIPLSMMISVLSPVDVATGRHPQRVSFPPWTPARLAQDGFIRIQEGSQAHITLARRHVRFALDADSMRADPVAARITELAPDRPLRWQPAIDRPITLSARVRFDQAQPPPHLTETIFFWAGLTLPVSAIGVTRDHEMYAAIVAINFDPQTATGVFHRAPVPATVRADAWHTIGIVVGVNRATITIDDLPLLDVSLPEPPPALAAELSVDNDNFPEGHLPVLTPDGLTVQSLTITQRDGL
jgi:hypothetical protein